MNKHPWILSVLMLSVAAPLGAATDVEMEACHYTAEVKRELQITTEQEPQVEKIYSDLAPMLRQIQNAMAEREQLRRQEAGEEGIEEATRKIIALENKCRNRGHELLRPILTEEQFQLILEMEEVHRRKARAARQPTHP
jgi:hypothetical protein